MDFTESSYTRHAEHFEKDLSAKKRIQISESWFDSTTADSWRHSRMYEFLVCLSSDSDSSWLTVGDGRWGLDSIRIKSRGFKKVFPTDISEHLLKESKRRGYIEDYSVENAEQLSFKNDSFDYVFCKESLHHFPRPYRALYELLRVARKGVFIIEPNDSVVNGPGFLPIRTIIKALFRNKFKGININNRLNYTTPHSWETVGNYVFTMSRREMEKIALGLNLPQLFLKGLNDHYIEGCELEPADERKSATFREIKHRISVCDEECRKGNADFSLLMVGLMKEKMSEDKATLFVEQGWSKINLPQNPYLK